MREYPWVEKYTVRKSLISAYWVVRGPHAPYGRTFFTWQEAVLWAVNEWKVTYPFAPGGSRFVQNIQKE